MDLCTRYSKRTQQAIQPRLQFMLAILSVHFLLILPQSALSLEIFGRCQDRCDEQRPEGVLEVFHFKCNEAYDTDEKRTACHESCESCPKEVCDEYIDANIWSCPAATKDSIPPLCKQFCNLNRPKGKPEKYTHDCNQHSNDQDKQDCINKCGECPDYICNPDENVFKCPRDILNSNNKCLEQCDKARDFGQVDAFKFKCSEKYFLSQDENEKKECQNACRDHCPSYICAERENPSDSETYDVYTCPAPTVNAKCKEKTCDKHRPEGSESSFKYKCRWCDSECSDCAPEGPNNYICNPSGTREIHCPPFDSEILLPKPSYKGPCKNKCEQNRGGGVMDFELHCDSRYNTWDEKANCKKICKEECSDACVWEVIKCKMQSKAEEDRREKILEHERKVTEAKKEAAREEFKNAGKKASTAATTLAVLIILLIVCTVTAAYCLGKRAQKAAETAHLAAFANQQRANLPAGQQAVAQTSQYGVVSQQQFPANSQVQMPTQVVTQS